MKILLLALTLLSTSIYSQEIISVNTILAPHNKKGFYDELFANFASNFRLRKIPLKRGFKMFKRDKASCILGGTALDYKRMRPRSKFVQSDIIITYGLAVYTLADYRINDVKQLKKEQISVLRGSIDYVAPKLRPYKMYEVSHDDQVLNMLFKKRVKVAIYWFPLPKAYSKKNLNTEMKLFQSEERLVCHATKESKKIVDNFNSYLKQVRKDKTIEKIFLNFFQKDDLKYLQEEVLLLE